MWENPLAAGAPPRTPLGSLQRSPDSLAGGWGWLPLRPQEPHHALGPSGHYATLALRASLLAFANLFTKIRLCIVN